MLLDQCPHCRTKHVHTNDVFHQQLREGEPGVTWMVSRCQNPTCKRLVLITNSGGQVSQIYPSGEYELDDSAPVSTEIRGEFREAGLCLGAGCYKASLVMSRRVLQRCLKEQGCTQHNLVDAIKHAVDDGILRKAFHPVAEEIRQYGNLGAHPDDDQLTNANRESAQHILDFVRLVIHDLYELPATVATLKSKRQFPNS